MNRDRYGTAYAANHDAVPEANYDWVYYDDGTYEDVPPSYPRFTHRGSLNLPT